MSESQPTNAPKKKTVKWGQAPKLTVLDALYLPAIA